MTKFRRDPLKFVTTQGVRKRRESRTLSAMTSARAYDGGIYSPYSETPIYDRLVAERGRPEIGPFNLPMPDFAMHPLFGERPALPALPALPSSYSSPAPAYGSAYGASAPGYGHNTPAPMPSLPAPLPVPAQYGGASPQYGGGQYNNAHMSGYASMAPAAPQAPQQAVHQAPQPGAGQYAAQYVQPPQVPTPRVPNMGEPGQFPPRY